MESGERGLNYRPTIRLPPPIDTSVRPLSLPGHAPAPLGCSGGSARPVPAGRQYRGQSTRPSSDTRRRCCTAQIAERLVAAPTAKQDRPPPHHHQQTSTTHMHTPYTAHLNIDLLVDGGLGGGLERLAAGKRRGGAIVRVAAHRLGSVGQHRSHLEAGVGEYSKKLKVLRRMNPP